MKTKLIFMACMAVASHPAQARLGETVEECEARYGKPDMVLDPETSPLVPTGVWRRDYTSEGYQVMVYFLNNRSGEERFYKMNDPEGKMPVADRDGILVKNLGEKYQPAAKRKDDAEGVLRWQGGNGNLGLFTKETGQDMLFVHTAGYESYCADTEAREKASEKTEEEDEKAAALDPVEQERLKKF